MAVTTDPTDLGRDPKPEPPIALRRSLPREVALSAGGRVLAVFAGVLVLCAIAVAVFLTREFRRQDDMARALVDHGAMTTAQVTRLWRGDDSKRRHVAYGFQIMDRVYAGQARMSPAEWQTLQVGSPLAVRYLPEDPSRSDLGRTMLASGPPAWLPFVLATALVTFAALMVAAISRQRRLLADGRVAPALVRGIKKHHTSHGGTHRSLIYEFSLLNGAVATGRSQASSKSPAVGSVVWVVYDPDRPSRSMTYPFQLVKPRGVTS